MEELNSNIIDKVDAAVILVCSQTAENMLSNKIRSKGKIEEINIGYRKPLNKDQTANMTLKFLGISCTSLPNGRN